MTVKYSQLGSLLALTVEGSSLGAWAGAEGVGSLRRMVRKKRFDANETETTWPRSINDQRFLMPRREPGENVSFKFFFSLQKRRTGLETFSSQEYTPRSSCEENLLAPPPPLRALYYCTPHILEQLHIAQPLAQLELAIIAEHEHMRRMPVFVRLHKEGHHIIPRRP